MAKAVTNGIIYDDSKPYMMTIPGFSKYQICQDGKVYNRFGRCLTPINTKELRIYNDEGRRVSVTLARIMRLTYFTDIGDTPLYHINQIKTDYSYFNLMPMDRKQIGRLRNRHHDALNVIKTMPNGREIRYRSAREAGRRNFMSYQTVLDYCNGKTKKDIAPDGCKYRWEK